MNQHIKLKSKKEDSFVEMLLNKILRLKFYK